MRGLDYYTRTVFEVYHGAHGRAECLVRRRSLRRAGRRMRRSRHARDRHERRTRAHRRSHAGAVRGEPGRSARRYYYVACVGAGAEARAPGCGAQCCARSESSRSMCRGVRRRRSWKPRRRRRRASRCWWMRRRPEVAMARPERGTRFASDYAAWIRTHAQHAALTAGQREE